MEPEIIVSRTALLGLDERSSKRRRVAWCSPEHSTDRNRDYCQADPSAQCSQDSPCQKCRFVAASGSPDGTPAPDSLEGRLTRLVERLEAAAAIQTPTTDKKGAEVIPIVCGAFRGYFPIPDDHNRLASVYFKHVNHFHPCLNVNETGRMCLLVIQALHKTANTPPATLAPYIALLMLMYACAEVISGDDGYTYYRQAEQLSRECPVPTTGTDMTGARILILQAIFHTLNGEWTSAYATIGRAARTCYQLQLHIPRKSTPFNEHMRQRVLYTTFCLDHFVALQCNLPPAMAYKDIVAVPQPIRVRDAQVHPGAPLPEEMACCSDIQPYMDGFISYAVFVEKIWEHMRPAKDGEARGELDVDPTAWLEQWKAEQPDCDEMALAGSQDSLISLLIADLNLRLQLVRGNILTFDYNQQAEATCGDLASEAVYDIEEECGLGDDVGYLPALLPTLLTSSMVALAILLVNQPPPGEPMATAFDRAQGVLMITSMEVPVAGRSGEHLHKIAGVVRPWLAASGNDDFDNSMYLTPLKRQVERLLERGFFPAARPAAGDGPRDDGWEAAFTALGYE